MHENSGGGGGGSDFAVGRAAHVSFGIAAPGTPPSVTIGYALPRR